MRLRLYLQEKYLGSYTKAKEFFDDERLPIYVNPDERDMRKFQLNGMRFVADGEKKRLYVWDEEVEVHDFMMSYLVKKGLISNRTLDYLFSGYCYVQGPKMKISAAFGEDAIGPEWKWLDRYFSNRREYTVN